jgi:hypothetical protein
MTLIVEPLGPTHLETLRALLMRHPAQNLHLLGRLQELGMSATPGGPPFEILGCFSDRGLKAAVFIQDDVGEILFSSPSASSELSAVAAHLKSRVSLRSSFGDEESVQLLVDQLATQKPPLFRRYRLLSACPDELGPYLQPALRVATESDLPLLVPLAARAIQETFGVDPLRENTDAFTDRVAQRIRTKRTYVLPSNGALVFKVDVASWTPFGAELKGIYTAPDYRCRGLATRSLGHLSRQLLSALPRLTLRADGPLSSVARNVGFRGGSTPQLLVTDSAA